MYTTIFFAGDNKISIAGSLEKNTAKLNIELKNMAHIDKCALVKTLLEQQADIHTLNQTELNALLHEAVNADHCGLIQILLNANADIHTLYQPSISPCCLISHLILHTQSAAAANILVRHCKKKPQKDPKK